MSHRQLAELRVAWQCYRWHRQIVCLVCCCGLWLLACGARRDATHRLNQSSSRKEQSRATPSRGKVLSCAARFVQGAAGVRCVPLAASERANKQTNVRRKQTAPQLIAQRGNDIGGKSKGECCCRKLLRNSCVSFNWHFRSKELRAAQQSELCNRIERS